MSRFYVVRLIEREERGRAYVPPSYLGAHLGLGPGLRPMPRGMAYCYETPEDAEAAVTSASLPGWTWKVEVL